MISIIAGQFNFDLSSGILNITTPYGTVQAENFTEFRDTEFNDVFKGSDNSEIFWSYQGEDSITGGDGQDSFMVATEGRKDSPIYISDYQIGELIFIKDVEWNPSEIWAIGTI